MALLICWGGCTKLPPRTQRLLSADTLAYEQSWQRLELASPPFVLTVYLPETAISKIGPCAESTLTIYIEGDGLAWVSRSRRSSDPTPIDPIGLRLALQHPDGKAAYLARPCQYTDPAKQPLCEARYWTTARFSPEVIGVIDAAVTRLREMTYSTSIRLVGYSGGGAVAALVAARREDVNELITVAGNLDHTAWAKDHRISPLQASLNPADEWRRLMDIPQAHITGEEDQNVGEDVLKSYLERFPDQGQISTLFIPGYTHQCCWAEHWPDLYWQAVQLIDQQ